MIADAAALAAGVGLFVVLVLVGAIIEAFLDKWIPK